jgi:hypothetical protein
MKNKLAVIIAAAVLWLALPVRSQVQAGGYLSLEYIKGQAESAYPKGSSANLLAGVLAQGRVGQKFGFAVEGRALGVSSFGLVEAWAGFMPAETFTVKAGLFLVPFGTWNRFSRPHQTVLIRTPLNLEYLYPESWRDIGVVVEGQVGVLTYSAYLGSGLAEAERLGGGQQFEDNNHDWAKGGRLGLVFSQQIQAGISYYTGKMDEQGLRDLMLEGVDLAWVTPQWEVRGEYTKALIDNPDPFERGKSEGWSVWMTMSLRSIQPFGSYQTVEYTDAYHGGGIALDHSRWAAGLRFVLNGALFIKAEYDWNKEKGTALKNNQLQVQLGLSF